MNTRFFLLLATLGILLGPWAHAQYEIKGDKHIDVHMELIQMMANRRIEYFYNRTTNGYSHGRRVNAAGVLADARKMLHDAHPAEAYTTTTVTDGSMFRTRY